MILRPAQEEILKYESGRMAVSAVPGSGKTFTLALLAAQLIAALAENGGTRETGDNQQVLIVTYLNASVDTFKARIRKRLEELSLPPNSGYEVRTLHSLALEIVRLAESGLGSNSNEPTVLDEGQISHFLSRAVDGWIEATPDIWHAFLSDDSPQSQARWRSVTESTARSFIRMAKNSRYRSHQIIKQLDIQANESEQLDSSALQVFNSPLLHMMTGIYDRYQSILVHQGALDFDDLIWLATDLLQARHDLTDELRRRWPYVLEDEAQDSVPLQEVLLSALTGPEGNWVRVGDPNQAITSSFTAANPRFFNEFIDRKDVSSKPLPNSGRSARLIIGAANAMLDWVIDHHPVQEVRNHTFRRQYILPTPSGDAQPNPPDSEASIRIKVFKHREDEEIPTVARLAAEYAILNPQHTLSVLVPTHNLGHKLTDYLDELDAPYDSLLRGGIREREIAAAMQAILAVLANPLDTKALANAFASLQELDHPAAKGVEQDLPRLQSILRSVHKPETLLYPWAESDRSQALPVGIATNSEEQQIERFASFIQELFLLRQLPIDDLALALGDELFAHDEVHEGDLAIAYQLASVLRYWRDMQPDWRLPELSEELANVVSGRRRLPLARPSDYGYEPKPGRITVSTQHSAKGLEWDAVYLLGIDGYWVPTDLQASFRGEYDFLGGDPEAEVKAQLSFLMRNDAGIYEDRSATESVHIEIISERLRLLYVGITRARRFLHISRSRATRQYNKEKDAAPATVLGVLYRYLKSQ